MHMTKNFEAETKNDVDTFLNVNQISEQEIISCLEELREKEIKIVRFKENEWPETIKIFLEPFDTYEIIEAKRIISESSQKVLKAIVVRGDEMYLNRIYSIEFEEKGKLKFSTRYPMIVLSYYPSLKEFFLNPRQKRVSTTLRLYF